MRTRLVINISVEVVDASSMRILAHSTVAKWRSYLKDNKRTLVLDLKPAGTMQVELRIFDEPARIPDRLDILIASASDLPHNVSHSSPFAKVASAWLHFHSGYAGCAYVGWQQRFAYSIYVYIRLCMCAHPHAENLSVM